MFPKNTTMRTCRVAVDEAVQWLKKDSEAGEARAAKVYCALDGTGTMTTLLRESGSFASVGECWAIEELCALSRIVPSDNFEDLVAKFATNMARVLGEPFEDRIQVFLCSGMVLENTTPCVSSVSLFKVLKDEAPPLGLTEAGLYKLEGLIGLLRALECAEVGEFFKFDSNMIPLMFSSITSNGEGFSSSHLFAVGGKHYAFLGLTAEVVKVAVVAA